MVDSSFLAATLRSLLKRCDALERKSTPPRLLCLDQLIRNDRLFPLRPPGVFFVNDGNDFKPEAVQYEYSDVELHDNEFTVAHDIVLRAKSVLRDFQPPNAVPFTIADSIESSDILGSNDVQFEYWMYDGDNEDAPLPDDGEVHHYDDAENHTIDALPPDDDEEHQPAISTQLNAISAQLACIPNMTASLQSIQKKQEVIEVIEEKQLIETLSTTPSMT